MNTWPKEAALKILAVDPGVTSGYCEATLTDDRGNDPHIELKPFQMVDDVDDIWRRLEKIKPRYIVCEDFEYRNRSRAGLVLFSVQAIGVIRLYELMAEHQTAVVLQKAATGKGFFTDTQLKNHGAYKRGIPHAMDATRHLLHWLTFMSGHQLVEGIDLKTIIRLV